YIISFVIWIGGIVLYLVYRNKPHPEDQKVAKNCLKLAIISLALIIAYNVIIAFLTFMAMRASYYVP
ncbi:MAG: hypothetical protein QXT63_06035, partial [Thermoplasmata archaeon]